MASIPAVAKEVGPGAAEPQPRPLSSRGRSGAREPDIEQALGSTMQSEMQSRDSGVRQRSVQASRAAQHGGESSSDSSEPLTPASSEDSQPSQAFRFASSTAATFDRLLEKVKTGIPELTSDDEEKEFYRKYGGFIKNDNYKDFPVGFPQLAALMKSDDDMAIFRSFDQVHFRILLQLQVELTQLESAVHKLDKSDEENEAMRYRLKKTYKEGWDKEKPDLIQKMKEKAKEYDEFLLNFNQVRALGRPPPRNYRSLFRWISMKGPLAPGYDSFIHHEKDFVALAASSEYRRRLDRGNYFEEKIRSHIRIWRNSPFKKMLRTRAEVARSEDANVEYLSADGIETMRNILLLLVANGTILIPVCLLFLIPMERVAMFMIVLAAVFPFSMVLCAVTGGKPDQVLFGTVAYGAILVTFLGNMNGGNGSQ